MAIKSGLVSKKTVSTENSLFNPKPLLWAALFLALIIRVIYLVQSQQSPFFEPVILDPEYYHRWALRILGGDWVGEPVFYGLPLYPFFLAFGYFCAGGSLFAVKLIQTLLGLVTVFFIFKAAEKMDGPKAAVVAAFMAAFCGPLFFHETLLIPEAIGTPLYAAAFYLALRFWEEPTEKNAVYLGLVSGLAALTKAGVIPFVIVFSLITALGFFTKTKRVGAGLVIFISFLLPLAPVTAHNLIYGKDFVPLTSHGGFNFYIGNNLQAEGVFLAPEGTGSNVESQIRDASRVAEREVGRSLKPSEVSKFWSDKATDYIKSNPGDFLRLTLHKLLLFFDAREISDVEDYEFSKQFAPILRFPWITFAIIGPLFLVGAVAGFKRIHHKPVFFVWTIGYIGSVVLFFINARYRLPVLSTMIAVAAIGIVVIVDSFRQKKWSLLGLALVVAGLGFWVTQMRLVSTTWEVNYRNAGDIFLKKKDFSQAETFFNKALKVAPNSSRAHLAMATTLIRQGRYAEAKPFLERAIEADPKNATAFNSLGLWYDRAGDLNEARKNFLKALELQPMMSEAHNNLGMVYGKEGDTEKAMKEFEISLKLNPRSARAHTNLGLILYRLGKVSAAKQHWSDALKVDPNFEEARRALAQVNA